MTHLDHLYIILIHRLLVPHITQIITSLVTQPRWTGPVIHLMSTMPANNNNVSHIASQWPTTSHQLRKSCTRAVPQHQYCQGCRFMAGHKCPDVAKKLHIDRTSQGGNVAICDCLSAPEHIQGWSVDIWWITDRSQYRQSGNMWLADRCVQGGYVVICDWLTGVQGGYVVICDWISGVSKVAMLWYVIGWQVCARWQCCDMWLDVRSSALHRFTDPIRYVLSIL